MFIKKHLEETFTQLIRYTAFVCICQHNNAYLLSFRKSNTRRIAIYLPCVVDDRLSSKTSNSPAQPIMFRYLFLTIAWLLFTFSKGPFAQPLGEVLVVVPQKAVVSYTIQKTDFLKERDLMK